MARVRSMRARPRTYVSEVCGFDRLSPLSDEILHRIFSHLDFLDVVRTSVLAKRWRHVWTSAPYLNFNMNWFVGHIYDRRDILEPHCKFWNFIKWCLLLRNRGSQIVRIRVVSDHTLTEQLNGLLCASARQNVEEIFFLEGDKGIDQLNFPRVICERLAFLTLNYSEVVSLRVAAVFSNLRSLTLIRISISGDVVDKLLSSYCFKLESVYLEYCQFRYTDQIIVSASCLKELTIIEVSASEGSVLEGCFNAELIVSAPNLLSFFYMGPMPRGFIFLNIESLQNATIRLLHVPWGFNENLPSPASFTGLNFARTLLLSSFVVKNFDPIYNGISWDTFILDKLKCLELVVRHNNSYIEGLITLLKVSPNLEALFIRFKEAQRLSRSKKGTCKVIANSNWEPRIEDVACLSYNVKTIRISNLDDTELAFELVKFLLQNGKVLTMMEIMHKGGERKRKAFLTLAELPKASSEVVLSFPKLVKRKIPKFDPGDSDPEYGN